MSDLVKGDRVCHKVYGNKGTVRIAVVENDIKYALVKWDYGPSRTHSQSKLEKIEEQA